MTGWQYLICRFPNEAAAIAMATQLGTELVPGTRDFGNENFCCHVFDQWDRWPGTNGRDDPGQLATGFWANVGFDINKTPGATAYAQLAASPYVQTPANPSNLWAGDS